MSVAVADTSRPPERAPRSGITLRQVGKIFGSSKGDITALQDITLDTKNGEFVTIIGPSGCGKSTLLRCMAGLLPPSSGTIELGGTTVRSPPSNLSFAFQRDVLLEWRTAIENVLLPIDFSGKSRTAWKEPAQKLLSTMGLSGFENRYPWELSGGMRQRVALCRALIQDPDCLLMDEPFGALDAITRDILNLEIQRLWLEKTMTVILVTHSIVEAVFLSDRVVVLSPNPGRILSVVEIDLPRPRTLAMRESSAFTSYVAKLREAFETMGVFGQKK
jgi:NitT/TauT family transport system ATP-binding protein